MYSFANDYSEGACPQVIDALTKNNTMQLPGYEMDVFCEKAADSIRKIIEMQDIDVHFIGGGTACNILAISLLKPHEAVISVESGHINVHEAGAVEATGHKIITVKGKRGKITPEEIINIASTHLDEHMVKPKMVFISNATEFGTIYRRDELIEIYNTCKKLDMYLYMDGARLSNALVSVGNDLTLKDICRYTDMFYLGGTKNGAFAVEAFIIRNSELKPEFRYTIKQHGAMMAKGRFLGLQMLALINDNTYLENARNANVMAQALKYLFDQFDVKMYIDSTTNQIFPILEDSLIAKIEKKYVVTKWARYDAKHTIVRFVCSWATKKGDIEKFYDDLLVYMNI